MLQYSNTGIKKKKQTMPYVKVHILYMNEHV